MRLVNFTQNEYGEEVVSHSETVPIIVKEHTACRCECKVREEHCSGLQEYDADECACLCRNTADLDKCERVRIIFNNENLLFMKFVKCLQQSELHVWNKSACNCRCRNPLPCSTGYLFDQQSCSCIKVRDVVFSVIEYNAIGY